jgi:glycerophosphoryl diester phosphodiesterase
MRLIYPFIYLLLIGFYSCQSPIQDISSCQQALEGIFTIQLKDAEAADHFYTYHPARLPLISAHRGGPAPGYPENAIETFEHTIRHTQAIIECDIMRTADGHLVMMHDQTLDRTTDGTGRVDEVSLEYIRSLRLKDNEGNLTDYKVPTLREVLEWGRDKVVFTLDVKRGVPYDEVLTEVEVTGSELNAVIITYSIRDAMLVHELNPRVRISISLGSEEAIAQWRESGIPAKNTVAFVGTSERDAAIYETLHVEGVLCILGTMGNLDRKAASSGDELYRDLILRGADILSTDRPIEAAEVLNAMIDKNATEYQRFIRFLTHD